MAEQNRFVYLTLDEFRGWDKSKSCLQPDWRQCHLYITGKHGRDKKGRPLMWRMHRDRGDIERGGFPEWHKRNE